MSEILIRTFDVEIEQHDGREIYGRFVPYGQVAEVADLQPDGTVREPYRESFERGAFSRATRAPQHVELTHEHDAGILATVGRAMEITEADDGAYATFRVFEGMVGDQALVLVREKILHGLSVVARTLGPGKRVGGVVVRTACHLEAVGLTRRPAYIGAEVLAVRSRLEIDAPTRDSALDDRLRALGIGTPAE